MILKVIIRSLVSNSKKKLEEAAYLEGNGKVPVQLFGDFCENRPSVQLGTVTPHIKGMYQLANVRKYFFRNSLQSR